MSLVNEWFRGSTFFMVQSRNVNEDCAEWGTLKDLVRVNTPLKRTRKLPNLYFPWFCAGPD